MNNNSLNSNFSADIADKLITKQAEVAKQSGSIAIVKDKKSGMVKEVKPLIINESKGVIAGTYGWESDKQNYFVSETWHHFQR